MKAIIAAIDDEYGIGKDGCIPWHFKEDFKWFKDKTQNAIIIMGYNTFQELALKFNFNETGKLLPNRVSYIISSREIKESQTVKSFSSIPNALKDIENNYPEGDIFFIGGTRIFEEAYYIADTIFLTSIIKNYECDTFFPVTKFSSFKLVESTQKICINLKNNCKQLLFFQRYDRNEI